MENTVKNQVEAILVNNNLNFRIEKLPLFAKNDKGAEFASPYFGLLNSKTGKIINTVKEGYCVSQNDEVVELVLRGMQNFGELSVQKAGTIKEGCKTFVQLGIDGHSKVNGDIIKRFVTVIDSNDGSTGLGISVGDLTMSCQNQFFKFYKNSQSKFRHTATMQKRIQELPYLIEASLKNSLKQIEIYNRFASTPITKQLVHDMVNYILKYDRTSPMSKLTEISTRSTNIMDSMYNHITKEMSQKGENMWGLFSGITSFTTHEKSKSKVENGNIQSMMLGTSYKVNQKAFDFASKQIEFV